MKPPHIPRPALYLRTDGTLMLVRGDDAVEIRLSTAQLLQIGLDCLAVATALQPACMAEAAAALADTMILPNEAAAAAPAGSLRLVQ